ncbi:MAG TPA: phage major capsid protein [Devosiaceae bacterium]|jgi:HK97 family phage major capsid protein
MQHITKSAILTGAMEIKGDDDTVDIVTKAIADLTKTVDERLKAVETVDTKALNDRLDKIETTLARPNIQTDKPTDPSAETKAFASYLRSFGGAVPAEELKTLTVSSDPQGGYLAPTEMATEFLRDLVEVSPIRAYASVRTTGAPAVSYPKRTAITNARWKGEAQTQEGSEPAFGQAEVPVRELNTFVDISNQLLADSAGQAEAEVREALAEDFAQKEGRAFLLGQGVLDPEGLLVNAGVTALASGAAAAITADALITLFYDLPATYRNAGAWAMNSTSLGALRKLKDGQGNYLWAPGLAGGQPDTILGRPVVDMVDMPDVAAGTTPIVFGDWSGYRIVDRIGLSILVNPFLLATDGVTRIHATRRTGGRVLQAAKFRKMLVAA